MYHRHILSLAVILSLGACSLSGKSTSQQPQPSVETPVAEKQHSRIDTIVIESKFIASPAKAIVALPAQALSDNHAEFPTVYLLHGYDGNYADWSKKVDLATLADKYGCIIVCPDGRDSWYFDSPQNPKLQMESYIIDELIPYVDDNFPTIIEPESRAITGLSMGGHGAMWLAMRHPDVFANVASMSGGVDITKFPNRWAIDKTLGRYESNRDLWAKHSVMSLVPTLKKGELNIMFDCGESDMFYNVNNALSSALKAKCIAHTYTHRPGNHSWNYWVKSLPQHLEFFKKNFDKAASEE